MKITKRNCESGIAMLLVIIALLLVTAVAAGMMIYSTSEVKVDANYRDEQVALFAAKAGLEEARDRMLAGNANSINGSLPAVLPGQSGGSYATYIVGSTGIQPWTSGNSIYNVPTFDSEFMCQLGSCTGTSFPNSSTCCTSTLTNASYSGPTSNQVPYQWVRVNLKTNESIDATTGLPRWVNNNGTLLGTAQVEFDSTTGHECVVGSLTGPCASSSTLQPVYEVTSYAVTPSGTIRMLQDDVAAYTFNLNLDSAVTIPGTVGSFSGGSSANYQIDGHDGQGSAPAIPGCTANTAGGPSVSVSSGTSASVVQPGMKRPTNYTGTNCTFYSGNSGCVGSATLPTNMSTPAELDATLAGIEQNANACLGCTAGTSGGNFSYSQVVSALPGGAWSNSSDNPQIVYVDGNLDISASSGSGILVVTGNLTFSGNSTWNGIILVVGQGTTTFNVNGGGNGEFDGEMLVATTKDSNGNTLPAFGTSAFNVNGGGGSGVFYNSCWVNAVQKPQSYVVLSSKEISQ